MVFQQSYCICKNNVDQTSSTATKGRVTIGIPVSSPLAANVIDLRTNTRHCSTNSEVWKLLFSPSESKVLKIMIHSTRFPHKSIIKHNSSTHYENINTLSFASSLWQICYIHLSAYCTNWNAVFSRKDSFYYSSPQLLSIHCILWMNNVLGQYKSKTTPQELPIIINIFIIICCYCMSLLYILPLLLFLLFLR